jgi:apolipoprotein N-acyltransferase
LWRLSVNHENDKVAVPNLVVWPETAFALVDTMDVRTFQAQAEQHMPRDTYLASGVLEADVLPGSDEVTFYNRLGVFNHLGQPVASYSKSHLVPFGEYLPFQKYWPVTPPAVTAGAFTAGEGIKTEEIPNFPSFSGLVCYEVIFPDAVVDNTHRPGFMLNVTNDAWYGRTSGPYQHLAISQTRSVEQGLPMIRAANTGMSAMIDARGRLVAFLPLNETGRLDVPLPSPLHATLFARYGIMTWGLLLIIASLIAFIGQAAQQKRLATA